MTIILVTIIIIAAVDNNFLLYSPGNLDPIRSIMRLVKMNYLSHFKIVPVCSCFAKTGGNCLCINARDILEYEFKSQW